MAGMTDPSAKGTVLEQELRTQLEPDVCSPLNYSLPGLLAANIAGASLVQGRNISLQCYYWPKARSPAIKWKGKGTRKGTPQSKARTSDCTS